MENQRKISVENDFTSLINNKYSADTKFVLDDGHKIYAHRAIIFIRSPRLYDIIKPEKNQKSGRNREIYKFNFENIKYETFMVLISYLYSGKLEINNPQIIVEMVKLFFRLDVKGIELFEKIIFANVDITCSLLQAAIQEKWKILEEALLEYISRNFLKIINTTSFMEIDRRTLRKILSFDAVSDVNEAYLFKMCIQWANQACYKNGIMKPNAFELRKHLGSKALKCIRFGAMTIEEFEDCLKLVPDLFTYDEIISIYLNNECEPINSMGFINERRIQLTDEICETKSSENYKQKRFCLKPWIPLWIKDFFNKKITIKNCNCSKLIVRN